MNPWYPRPVAASTALKVRFGRGLPAFLAAVFLLSCLANTAHLAMAEGQGCQASHPSVRSCEPTVSLDMGPALAGSAPSLNPALAPARWITPNVPATGLSLYRGGPPVPRSPPSLLA